MRNDFGGSRFHGKQGTTFFAVLPKLINKDASGGIEFIGRYR